MTPDQFNDALARCIDYDATHADFACYPAIGLTGNANGVVFWDNERHIVSAGVFVDNLTQDAIDRAIAYASSRPISDIIGDAVPCVILPLGVSTRLDLAIALEDIGVMYFVELTPDGLLAFSELGTDTD